MPTQHAQRSRSLLVIEDDVDIQDLVEGFFRPRGFATMRYEDAISALGDLRHGRIQADVVLTDLNLRRMTGIEFVLEAKRLGIPAPIILITAQKSSDVAVRAVEAGAYDFIVKPLHFPQLLVSVERALHFSRMNRENEALKAAVRLKEENGGPDVIIGKSPGLLRALDLARRVADSTANVFVSGESGTGKEVIARAIHRFGKRRDKPFVAINCSAIPENLLESELFGYAKGAFTGANEKKLGLFEEADGGTLFLDEIGDLGLTLQAKLLRVLQERKIKRLGENQTRDIDVRVISATHKNLSLEVSEGRFREDLLFRLNVIPIALPPLRERREDILPLASYFLAKFSALNGSPVRTFTKDALETLLADPWRGNVRELENRIERAVVLGSGDRIDALDLTGPEFMIPTSLPTAHSRASSPAGAQSPSLAYTNATSNLGFPLREDGELMPLTDLIDAYFRFALARNGGAKDKTARALGIDRKTLYKRVREIEEKGGPGPDPSGPGPAHLVHELQ